MKRTAFKAIRTVVALALVMAMTLGLAASAATSTYTFKVNPKVGESITTMTWDDAYLDGPTTVYNADLAKFCMDAASLDRAEVDSTDREDVVISRKKSIKDAFLGNEDNEGLGFEAVDQYLYEKSRSIEAHTTAYTVARKSAEANGKDVTVYFVVIHPDTLGEVMSDFDFAAPVSGGAKDYDTTLAYPFTKSAETVKATLDRTVNKNENVRFIVTGESRGGGAANYLAKLLTDEYGPHKVQAYTFSTPNVAIIDEADANSSYYYNIFNIVNPEDIVTYMPLESWGFSKYGRTLVIDAKGLVAKTGTGSVANIYKKYSEHSFASYKDNGATVQELEKYIFEELAPTVEDYYTKKYPAYKEYRFQSYPIIGGSAVATGKTVELSTYEFVRYVFGLLDMFSGIDMSGNLLDTANAVAGDILVLYEQLKSIDSDPDNVFNPVLKAVLKHAFGYSNIDALINALGLDASSFYALGTSVMGLLGEYGTDFEAMFAGLGEKIPQKEGVAAHMLYGYRAYMESATNAQNLYTNESVLTDGETGGEIYYDEYFLTGLIAGRAFYDDMTLTCDVTEGYNESEVYADFDLALSVVTSRSETTPLEPNGPVTVYLDLYDTENLPKGSDLTLTHVETGEEIEFEFEEDLVIFQTDTLGTFRVSAAKPTETKIVSAVNDGEKVTVKVTVNETAANRLILAGYDSKGKMTGIKSWVAAADEYESVTVDTFLPNTVSLKLFITTEDYLEALSEVKPFTVN